MPSLTDVQIKELRKKEKILIIRNHKVYDVTKFSKSHPGGEKVIQVHHGKDVTQVMKSGVHSHSENAFRWLEQYYIADYANGCVANRAVSNGKVHSNGVDKLSSSNHKSTESETIKSSKPDLVDWNRPILWQVGNMGAAYHDWIDDPVDKPLRLFKSNFVEFFSSTPWYIIPIVWLPVVALFIHRSYQEFLLNNVYIFSIIPVPLYSMPLLFIIGMVSWTFTEYALHRWLFHRDPPTSSYFLITLHFLLHGQHHKVPFDSGRLVFPPVPAAILGFLLYNVVRIVLTRPVTDIMGAGLLLGYIMYDLTHYYLHYGSPKRGSYFDRLRAYHVRHHFESPHLGFGISSMLWDHPFNTLIPSNRKNN